MPLRRLARHRRVVAARARFGELRHRQLYPLRDRLERLEASLPAPAAPPAPWPTIDELQERFAPVLWQELGRSPHPPMPSIGELLAADRGVGERLSERVRRYETSHLAGLRALPERLDGAIASDPYPLPTPEDRTMYSAGDDPGYWLSGLADASQILALAEQHGVTLNGGFAFLDFGCNSGRVLRHFPHLAPEARLYGADVSTVALAWARRHLSPDLVLLQGTVVPTLPLADDSLDLLWAGSVFTHMGDFEEAWLCELRRVLRPGGLALLTVHGEWVWDAVGSGGAGHLAAMVTRQPHRADPPGVEPVDLDLFRAPIPAGRVVVTQVNYPINNLLTFHTQEFLRRSWGRIFELVTIVEKGHGHFQDIVVLRAR